MTASWLPSTRSRPHVQDVQVDEALRLASVSEVQAIIGIGGGSPLGMAKATAYKLGEVARGMSGPCCRPKGAAASRVIAIPTTYAGSEMTPALGLPTDRGNPPRKVTVSDPHIAPQLVIYDPLFTLDLPPELTASTGINALAHCIEALYSVSRNPLSSGRAQRGDVPDQVRPLPACYTNGQDLRSPLEMLLGAHLAGCRWPVVQMGLHHGLCHVCWAAAVFRTASPTASFCRGCASMRKHRPRSCLPCCRRWEYSASLQSACCRPVEDLQLTEFST